MNVCFPRDKLVVCGDQVNKSLYLTLSHIICDGISIAPAFRAIEGAKRIDGAVTKYVKNLDFYTIRVHTNFEIERK